MAGTMISSNWARSVLPIMRNQWYQRMQATPSAVMQLFGVESSNSSVEYSEGIGDYGLVPEYNHLDDTGSNAIEYDKFSRLYETTFTHKEYAKATSIERKLVDDENYGLINRRARMLGTSFGQTRASHAASVFENAFSGVLGSDGVVLCSASHPNRPDDTSTTHSNLGTSALSDASVKATLIAGKSMVDDRGNPLPANYDTIVVPAELEPTAWTIVNSINQSGTADNDGNYVGSKNLKVITEVWLTDADNWFMVDSSLSQDHLLWFNRVMPEFDIDANSNFNLVANYRGYMRYSFGWDDWRFIYGHNVS